METERKSLIDLVNKQQIMITKCVDKIEMWEIREKEIEEINEQELKEMEKTNKEEDPNNYEEPVDYNASQDSVQSFGTKVGVRSIIDGEKKEGENYMDDNLRRCDRLLDKQDANIEETSKTESSC